MSGTNRLANETSLYLRQHARNPVDWYPWGPEALGKARELDRPLFVSVGYSACHWCHVMEKESFENEQIGELLNAHFVSVKIDREERPDLDAIFMSAVQLLNDGQGGWPMSVFLTPDGQPFFAGTYFPPDDRYGRPGFRRLLLALADAWRDQRDKVIRSAAEITRAVRTTGHLERGDGAEPDESLVRRAAAVLRRLFDPIYGGFGRAPKFPHATDLRLLLRVWQRFDDDDALAMTRHTLDKMARGGMYDQLGGGFHRYSVDDRWLVPHFEKMLYDNALLGLAYLEGFLATGEPFYRQIVTETLDYVLREMTSPHGGFYSTQDADSEGEEGKFFVWSKAEIEQILGSELARVAIAAWAVTDEGNFESHNILFRAHSDEQDARLLNLPIEEFRAKLASAREQLLAVRAKRIWPGRDEKILTAWNGMMIDTLARAGASLDEPRYTTAAVRAAEFVLAHLRASDGRLWRTCGADGGAKLNAYLEDYAFLADGLVTLYEATFEPRWLQASAELANVMLAQFHDPVNDGFFFTSSDHEQLLTRSKDIHDGSTPSGNSMAVTALLRLAALTGRADLREKAAATLRLFRGLMAESPTAIGQMLLALDFHVGPVDEVAIVGDPNADDTRQVLRAIHRAFRPNRVIALHDPANGEPPSAVPLLAGKTTRGPVTVYVCRNFACQAPLVGVDAAIAALPAR